jgi:hypothetical protein
MEYERAVELQCFRNKEYRDYSLKCVGGLDPTVLDPTTGNRRYRTPCAHLALCKSQCGQRAVDPGPMMGSRSLAPLPPPQQGPLATAGISRSMQPHHVAVEPSRPTMPQGTTMMNPWDAYLGPSSVPVLTPPPPAVSSVVTFPEPVRDDVSPWVRWLCEAARAGLGSACQQSAYSIFTRPWTRPQSKE